MEISSINTVRKLVEPMRTAHTCTAKMTPNIALPINNNRINNTLVALSREDSRTKIA